MKKRKVVALFTIDEVKDIIAKRGFETYYCDGKTFKVPMGSGRLKAFVRDNFTCTECGTKGIQFQLCRAGKTYKNDIYKGKLHLVDEKNHELEQDHIFPQVYGGIIIPQNIQTLCGHCNRKKGHSLLWTLKRSPKKLFIAIFYIIKFKIKWHLGLYKDEVEA